MTGNKKKYGPLYGVWDAMKQRCFNKNCKAYKDYGGRGITVCKRWVDSFEKFSLDMGERPAGHQLDRINVNGNYTPKNCRWVTQAVNLANTRKARYLTFNRRKMHVAAWAREIGMHPNVLLGRLDSGWSIKDALTTPARKRVSRTYQHNGAVLNITDLARKLGTSRKAITYRLDKGWSLEKIISSPFNYKTRTKDL